MRTSLRVSWRLLTLVPVIPSLVETLSLVRETRISLLSAVL